MKYIKNTRKNDKNGGKSQPKRILKKPKQLGV